MDGLLGHTQQSRDAGMPGAFGPHILDYAFPNSKFVCATSRVVRKKRYAHRSLLFERCAWKSAAAALASARVIGTIINVCAIILGGLLGLLLSKSISQKVEYRIKLILGLLTIYVGMKTTWSAINGSFGSVIKQIVIVLVALVVGNIIGKVLRLQHHINKLGEYAKNIFQKHDPSLPNQPKRFGEGFVTCTILFCVGPMAIVGSLEDGLSGKYQTLAVKSVMDGLATMAFVKTFGIGPIFAALPVLAYQGTITLGAEALKPILGNHLLLDSISATGGLLILCISVVILDIQKVPLADYLPSLFVAPVLTWLFR
jgi:uncharacterized membrane protein YqgA involved in biofilm formation